MHATPEGTKVRVDGRELAATAGRDGLLVAAKPGQSTTLELSKDGYDPHVETVDAPTRGTRSLYVNLRRSVAEVAVELPSKAAPVEVRRVVPARSNEATKPRPQAAAPTTLVVRSEPADAQLLVDGARIPGGSPHTVDGLSEGRHRVRVEANGYEPSEQIVAVQAGRQHELVVALERRAPAPAKIDVVTVPAGAEIEIDGRPVGRSPLVGLQLEPGKEAPITIRLRGHKDWLTRLVPTSGANPTVLATLEPVASAASTGATSAVSQARAAEPDLSVPRETVGTAARGASLFGARCGKCHGSSAPAVDTRRYTRDQWSRYFENRRHQRWAPLAPHLSAGELADVKAFLLTRAADVQSDVAAGVK